MHAGIVHAEVLPGADDATASGLAVPGGVACMAPDPLLLGLGVVFGAANFIGGVGISALAEKEHSKALDKTVVAMHVLHTKLN
jgi:hypothetical protein